MTHSHLPHLPCNSAHRRALPLRGVNATWARGSLNSAPGPFKIDVFAYNGIMHRYCKWMCAAFNIANNVRDNRTSKIFGQVCSFQQERAWVGNGKSFSVCFCRRMVVSQRKTGGCLCFSCQTNSIWSLSGIFRDESKQMTWVFLVGVCRWYTMVARLLGDLNRSQMKHLWRRKKPRLQGQRSSEQIGYGSKKETQDTTTQQNKKNDWNCLCSNLSVTVRPLLSRKAGLASCALKKGWCWKRILVPSSIQVFQLLPQARNVQAIGGHDNIGINRWRSFTSSNSAWRSALLCPLQESRKHQNVSLAAMAWVPWLLNYNRRRRKTTPCPSNSLAIPWNILKTHLSSLHSLAIIWCLRNSSPPCLIFIGLKHLNLPFS